MKKQIEKVKTLKEIQLHYSDGSIIAVPEDKALRIGTTFMKIVGKENIEWHIIRDNQPTIWEKIRGWLEV